MKIAIIAHPRFPIKSPFAGGLEAFIASVIPHYARHWEVTLYAHPESDFHEYLVSFPIDEKAYKKYPELVENDFLLKVMQDISSKKFDVVHNNAISPIPPVWACKYQLPLLTTLHTPPYSRLKASAELASLSPWVHYVAVSQSVADAWQPYINDSIDVIYNGIDLHQWQCVKTKQSCVFSFGRILPSKGFDLAAKAAIQLNIPLKIAGPIYDHKYFETVIAPLLGKHVSYLGHLSHQQLQAELRQAKAAIFAPRWDEPFGLSTVEAMASGTPVAAFNRGAFSEIVAEAGGSLATGNNVNSLAVALEQSFNCHADDVTARAAEFPLHRMCEDYLQKLSAII